MYQSREGRRDGNIAGSKRSVTLQGINKTLTHRQEKKCGMEKIIFRLKA
jgi:hypothetical protein